MITAVRKKKTNPPCFQLLNVKTWPPGTNKETTGVGFRSVKEGFLIGTVMMTGHSSDIKCRTGWLRTIGRGQREKKSQKVAKDQKSNRVMRKRDEREITAPPEIALGKEKVEG